MLKTRTIKANMILLRLGAFVFRGYASFCSILEFNVSNVSTFLSRSEYVRFQEKVALFTYSFEPKEDLKLDVSKKVTYIPRALITCFSDKANGLRRN